MIDFQNASVFKLHKINDEVGENLVCELLVENEIVLQSYKTVRDMVIFTNKRVIAVNIQGVTGMKKDFSSLPYRKIQAYSIETSGVFDLDGEMQLYFSSLGKVTFEFLGVSNLKELNRVISSYIL